LTYTGNDHGDVTAGGIWVNLTASAGLDIRANAFNGYFASGSAIGIQLASTTVSFTIESNRFYNLTTACSLLTSSDYGSFSNNYHSNVTTYLSGTFSHTANSN